MTPDISEVVHDLRGLTVGELSERYIELFGERTRSRHKEFLVRRIAWRIQANAEGDLSQRARRRAEELADEADLRLRAPSISLEQTSPGARSNEVLGVRRMPKKRDPRIPAPGSVIRQRYRGEEILVTVLEKGFEHEGERYRSLSAVAKAITGSHLSGFAFFGLGKKASRR